MSNQKPKTRNPKPPPSNAAGYSKRDYRAAIRYAWLPITGRKKLSTFEYKLVDQWFDQNKPIRWVLEAIKNCEARARNSGGTLFSIGVIRADLFAVEKQKAHAYVGGMVPGSKPETTNQKPETDSWREDWETVLLEAWEQSTMPDLKAMYSELIEALPGLTPEQVAARAAEIAKQLNWS